MRIFAGPNGSGKSMMYQQVRTTQVEGRPINLGRYLNPDDIAKTLWGTGELDLKAAFGIERQRASLVRFASSSGLLRGPFNRAAMMEAHRFKGSRFVLLRRDLHEHFAQLITAFLCDLLIKRKHRFSFETVFSHPSKLKLMQQAAANGFKVYLYFIATNSVEINKERVKLRVAKGGHAVPSDRIEKRYHLSLGQLLPALDASYHAFLFDNSGTEPLMFAEMKRTVNGRTWAWSLDHIPDWFIKHYLLAAKNPIYEDVARQALAARM